MKRLIGTLLLTAGLGLVLSGCGRGEPTMAPVPDPLPDRPSLNSVPDDAVYVATTTGMAGFTYRLLENQPFYVVDLEADRVLMEGSAEDDGEIEYKDGDVTFNGRRIHDGEAAGGRRVGLFVKRELLQDSRGR